MKGILRKCVICKRYEGKPFPTPKEPHFPSGRVGEDPPFTNTGIDFAGPLYTASNQKVHVCLFTCACTRAVHLELIDSLPMAITCA